MKALLTTFLAAAASFLFTPSNALSTRTVYQFSNPTWLENIVAMRNGSLLVTVVGRPEIHIVNPLATPSTASLAASIPDVNAALGITELSNNMFAVAAGNVTADNTPVSGSFSVWSIDLTRRHGAAKISKMTDVPAMGMVNGLTALDKRTLLLADSWKGNIVALDVKSGDSSVWFEDESTASNFSAPGLQLGVNGIKAYGEWVYFTNTVRNSLSRIRVDAATRKPVSEVKVLAQGDDVAMPDDFAVLRDGSVILGRPLSDELIKVDSKGTVQVIATVEGVTAVALGRSKADRKAAYLSSMGGFTAEGGVKAGGRIVAVQLR
ncbi:hypothetical protein N0V86_003368 [Didymella sp. IMI 355093]|nr:hypothetical protein N0V86_003368 [Didymella sp. IMI 355093]